MVLERRETKFEDLSRWEMGISLVTRRDTAPVGVVAAIGNKGSSTASTPAAAVDSISLSPPSSSSPPPGQTPDPESIVLIGSQNSSQLHMDDKGHAYMAGQLLKELRDNNLLVENPDNKALQLANHTFKNLLDGAVQDDGNHLKPYLKDTIATPAPMAFISTTTSSTTATTTINTRGTITIGTNKKDYSRFGKRPFRVHVSKDKGQLAFADGYRNIVIEQDLIQAFGYDEDMVAAVLAHELAHAMQDHVHEQEADFLSLEILARSGYDPITAARLQKFLVESKERPLLAKVSRCTTLTQKKAFSEVGA
ncbi:hypothetical protein BGZ96_002087 [Linnemannia gamsii]|uniref:Peptidase M48 domain-containing protein n=1 Tax=Linnemannia gamsii TaxID=64522 RepID=A0ABQ7K969_9FUNG|nr:hypothetical protein BGZ96_002087 [Linnemannia gamsii]